MINQELYKMTIVASPADTIDQVVRQMAEKSREVDYPGLAVILDKDGILLGIVTDGDIRRAYAKNIIFSVSAGYYSMYYSLYSILMRIGVKCEIHQCSIKFMEKFLDEFFSKEHINQISSAFKLRNITQYYVDKIIDKKEINNLLQNAPDFVEHSKNILSSINQDKINEIRNKLNE